MEHVTEMEATTSTHMGNFGEEDIVFVETTPLDKVESEATMLVDNSNLINNVHSKAALLVEESNFINNIGSDAVQVVDNSISISNVEVEATPLENNNFTKSFTSEGTKSKHAKLLIGGPMISVGEKKEGTMGQDVKNEASLKGKSKNRRKRVRGKKKEGVEIKATNSEQVKMAIGDLEAVEDEKKEGAMKKDVQNAEGNLKKKAKKSRNRKKKNRMGGASDMISKDVKEEHLSNKKSTKVEGSGMIFMCNSKTKKDCYHYKVLGLPASKKDLVSKIYKGMRLFLFDSDLKLMYGIYKAAGNGGFNIEPKAFNSAYPSQVKFTVLDDCLPLAEEKFRTAIKDNYYTRNKFNCELTSEQVKNLCKLFKAVRNSNGEPTSGKKSKSERAGRGRVSSGVQNSSRLSRTRVSRTRVRDWEGSRQQYHRSPVMYDREALMSSGGVAFPHHQVPAPLVPLVHLPQSLPPPVVPASVLPPSYSYERPLDVNLHVGDRPLHENHDSRYLDHGRRLIQQGDPYSMYREAPVYQRYHHGAPVQYRRPRSPSPEYHLMRPEYRRHSRSPSSRLQAGVLSYSRRTRSPSPKLQPLQSSYYQLTQSSTVEYDPLRPSMYHYRL